MRFLRDRACLFLKYGPVDQTKERYKSTNVNTPRTIYFFFSIPVHFKKSKIYSAYKTFTGSERHPGETRSLYVHGPFVSPSTAFPY